MHREPHLLSRRGPFLRYRYHADYIITIGRSASGGCNFTIDHIGIDRAKGHGTDEADALRKAKYAIDRRYAEVRGRVGGKR